MLLDNVAQVHPESKVHALLVGKCRITGAEFFLNRQRYLDCTSCTREDREHTVASGIDDAATVRRGVIVEHRPACLERGYGGPIVGLHQPGVTGNVRRKNGDQSLINVQVR